MASPEHTPAESDTIWREFRNGSKAAFEQLMQAHYRSLFGYGCKFTRDSDFVKDCVQELFLELWKNRATIGDTCSPRFYLLKSLRRKINRELHRTRWHAQNQTLDENYHFDVVFSAEQLLIREQAAQETAGKITQLLNQLPRRQKEILYLRFFQELDIEEIVEVMEISHQSVYNLMHKAITNLRQHWLSESLPYSLAVLIAMSVTR